MYSPSNPEFQKLVQAIVDRSIGSVALRDKLSDCLIERVDDSGSIVEVVSERGREKLFNMLIGRGGDSSEIADLKEIALETIPDDAYFGTIESYFSRLVNPKRRSQSFRRLINYYWCAFFSVAEPLIHKACGSDRLLGQKDSMSLP